VKYAIIIAMTKDFNKHNKSEFSKDEQLNLIEKLLLENKELHLKNSELLTKYILAEKENEKLLLRQEQLEAQLYLLKEHIYGSKSEKTKPSDIDEKQLRLFDFPDVEDSNEEDEAEEEIEVKSFTRKKRKKTFSKELSTKEIVIDIFDEDKTCACGCEKECIGEVISSRLEFVPQTMVELIIKRKKYSCKKCEGTAEEGIKPTIITAPLPKFLIRGGIATSSLLAQIFVSKYVDAIPFYRQEKQFNRFSDSVSRQSMSFWAMKAADSCTPLYDRIKKNIHSGPLINMDETRVQVLKEPGKKPSSQSYMWVMYGGPPKMKSVFFKYSPSRSGSNVKELLDDYSGCVQSDDYSGYAFLSSSEEYNERIVRLPCLVHIRRKFRDVEKVIISNKKKYKKTFNNVSWILRRIGKIYRHEKLFGQDNLSGEKLIEARRNKILPLINANEERINTLLPAALPSSDFAVALGYASKNLPKLKNYIELPFATPDNNLVENLIRPFAIGRKNWIFMGNPRSARASSILYSLVQTAIINELNPWNYLRYIFDRIPWAESAEEYDSLLPWNLTAEDIEKETDITCKPVFKIQ